MTTDPKTLIERFPLTAEACKLDANVSSLTFSALVRDYARKNRIGDSAFDSVESLMQAIETLLDAIEAKLKAERPMSDEEIEGMKWTSLGCMVGPKQVVTFHAANDSHASSALTRHNSDIDTLHAEIKRWRAKAEGKQ